MDRAFLALGALLAFVGVGAGAFGAHAIASRVTPDRLATFETGVRYQLWHAFGLFVVVFLRTIGPDTVATTLAGWLFVAGILLFSGSLYALVLSDERRWGAVTPIGGLCFLAGWLSLLVAAVTMTIGPELGPVAPFIR